MSVALHIWVSIHHLIVFCCTSLKWWHLHMLFSFFFNSGFLGCYVGVMDKKWPTMTKKDCHPSYLRDCTSYDCGFWYTCVKWWYLQHFFFFFFFSFLQNSDFRFFQSLSINAKRKLWDLPTFFTCVWFFLYFSSLQKGVYMECNKIFRSNVNFSY